MSATTRHRHAFVAALRLLGRQPATTLLTVLLSAAALGLALFAAALALALQPAWSRLDAAPQALVFVSPGTSSNDLQALRSRLLEQPGVTEATLLPRDAALADLGRRAPGGALPEIRNNPLPDAIRVSFARMLPTTLEAAVEALRKLPRVDAIQFDGAAARQWWQVSRGLRLIVAGAALALLLIAMGLLVVAARALPQPDAGEHRLLRLLGAEPGFVRRPRAWAGALIGCTAGLVAVGATAGAWAGLRSAGVELPSAPWSDVQQLIAALVAFVCGAAVLGALGGASSAAVAGRADD